VDVDFQIALPEGWTALDLLASDEDHLIDGKRGDALAAAARGSEHAKLLMLCSLVAYTPDGEPLEAGLSVALADSSAPISAAPLSELSVPDGELAAVRTPAGSGVRVTRMTETPALPELGRAAMLSVQYLLHTDHGLLTLTFTTPQVSRPDVLQQFFDAMASTGEIV
jgi:hypothetical protein